eukprot:1430059-Pyramimonas_sp.AAC.1
MACGKIDHGRCGISPLIAGLACTQVAAGISDTVTLRSDGTAVACAYNDHGQCEFPALNAGLTYTQVVAEGNRSRLRRTTAASPLFGNAQLSGYVFPKLLRSP